MVTKAEYRDWFDSDGRLVKEARMRQRLFEAGVDPSCRCNLWKFLFGIYPMNSTLREQKTIDVENRAHYQALRDRWEVLDKAVTLPDDDLVDSPPYMELSSDEEEEEVSTYCPAGSKYQQVLDRHRKSEPSNFHGTELKSSVGDVARSKSSSVDETGASASTVKHVSTCEERKSPIVSNSGRHPPRAKKKGSSMEESGDVESTCSCNFRRRSCDSVLDEEGRALLQILEFPSKVFATRQPVDLEKSYPKAKRIILRDVLRTDRNFHYYTHKRNLRKVHRVLMVYALYHPDIGYAQGMNDLLARFLVVTNSEVDSYWMFARYMEVKRGDFLEHTMMKKVALVKNLIKEIDQGLYQFFERSECEDYLFCHRWLLLDFKREFQFQDSLRIFEVLGSHYLELNSDKALVETDKAIAKEFELDAGEMRAERALMNLEFTFDLFVCVAILTMHSNKICCATDAASVYGCLNSGQL